MEAKAAICSLAMVFLFWSNLSICEVLLKRLNKSYHQIPTNAVVIQLHALTFSDLIDSNIVKIN